MAKFMDVHHGMFGITPEALKEAWCVSEAPDADAVRRIHERTGHPATDVFPVPVEV